MNKKLIVLGAIMLAAATLSGCVWYGYGPGYSYYPYGYGYYRHDYYQRHYGPPPYYRYRY